MVSWISYNQDGSGDGIYAQRYDAGGAAVGGEFRVNTTTLELPVRTCDHRAERRRLCGELDVIGQDGSGLGIYAQRYAAGGARREASSASTAPPPTFSSTRVAALADGGYVVSWMSYSQDGSG